MIRRAEPADIPRISELLKQIHGVHAEGRPDIFKSGARKYTENDLISLIDDDTHPIYVYTDGKGEVLGHLFCVFRRTEESDTMMPRLTLFIDDLCVDEKARRHGIGSALFRYAGELARRCGADSITLNVWDFNSSARQFYESCGMEPLRTTMELKL